MTKNQLKKLKTRTGIRSMRKENQKRKQQLQKTADAKNKLTEAMQ